MAKEVCQEAKIWPDYLSKYRRKHPEFRLVEEEIRNSPEAASLFLARYNLPGATKNMIETSKGAKDATKAYSLIRQVARGAESPKPAGIEDYEDKYFADNVVPMKEAQ